MLKLLGVYKNGNYSVKILCGIIRATKEESL